MSEMTLKEYALYYAALGLAVFPLQPGKKKPATANGCKAATTDPERISIWWDEHPDHNIGIATGSASGGLVVIDLDRDKDKGIDGYEVLKKWQREHGTLPETSISITGRGGYHYFYRDSAQWQNRVGLYDGVDIRAEGGYVVAPPSIHPNGRRYEWEQDPTEYGFTGINDLVLKFLVPVSETRANTAFQIPDQILSGARTDTLVKLVCSQQAKGLSDDAIRAAVRAENAARCFPPLTDRELEKEVFPALTRYQKGTAPYNKAVPDNGGFRVAKPAEPLDVISARELQKLDIPPAEFIVRDFLPLGLSLLGAPAKSYKSYMCLDMALCICRGSDFLGFGTKKCACLYMDLESTRRRPKSRIEQILKGEVAPDDLYIVTKAPPLGKGFEERVREEKAGHPEIGLVIVDVFKKVRPSAKKYTDPYERDYEDYGLIKSLADELNIAILLVTHTTKMKHPEDPFNELSGSAGTMGSIDAAMVIKKENREDETAKLYITGRDLESQCYEIKFNRKTFRWEMQGTHKDMEQLRAECEYRNSPIVRTIKILLDQNDGHWKGTASDMIKASQYFKSGCIHDKPQQIGTEINRFIPFLKKMDKIGFHREPTKKTNLLEFWYFDSTVSTVSDDSTVSTFPASEWEYCGEMIFDDLGGNRGETK